MLQNDSYDAPMTELEFLERERRASPLSAFDKTPQQQGCDGIQSKRESDSQASLIPALKTIKESSEHFSKLSNRHFNLLMSQGRPKTHCRILVMIGESYKENLILCGARFFLI